MRRWWIFLAIALLLLGLALIFPRWGAAVLAFFGANADVIQALEAALQIALFLGSAVTFLFGWRERSRAHKEVTAGTAHAEDEAVVVQHGGVAAHQVAIGRDVYGDVIVVADPRRLWQHIRRRLPEAELEGATEAYLRYLVDRYYYLELKGMGVTDKIALRLPLLDVYVPLRARMELPEGEAWAERLRVAGRKPTEDEVEAMGKRLSEPISVLDLVRDNDGLIILGDPGAGKTTFLKYLALMLAQGRGESLNLGHRLPILVPLAAYADALSEGDIPLDTFIERYYQNRGIDVPLGTMLNEALDKGAALVLLDGLDEVRDLSQRHLVVNRVLDFYTFRRKQGNKFVITSRIVGYREVRPAVKGLAECTLVDFDDEDIERFVTQWTQAIERAAKGETRVAVEDAATEREELLQAINRHPGVRRLAANPLLLTILALMKRQGIVLPERRVELYHTYVETLLKHWNLARGLDPRYARDLDVKETLKILGPLALWMQETSPGRGLVKQEALRRQLVQIYTERGFEDPEAHVEKFIKDVREHAALLLERGAREYGFIHLTFQEYLAAVGIGDRGQQSVEPVVEILAQHVGEEAWWEVSLLTIGYMGIIQQRDEAAAAVVQELMGRAPGEPGEAVILVGEAVHDAWPGGVTRQARQEVVYALLSTMRDDEHVSPVLRSAAGRTLAKLGDPRIEVLEPLHIKWIEIPAGPFLMGEREEQYTHTIPYTYWISRYPITNAQFQAFVEAGGYEEPRYWTKAGWRWKKSENVTGPPNLDEPWNLANHPRVAITWYEALAFTRWLTEQMRKEGLLREGYAVQLPNEPEWEKAARGGLQIPAHPYNPADPSTLNLQPLTLNPQPDRVYPWGNDPDPNRANYRDTGIGTTSAVGCFSGGASPYGVEEMSGNVWEWTRSVWKEYPYDSTDGRENLDAPRAVRVLRGGSFDVNLRVVRCSLRGWDGPDLRDRLSGFRVVVSPFATAGK